MWVELDVRHCNCSRYPEFCYRWKVLQLSDMNISEEIVSWNTFFTIGAAEKLPQKWSSRYKTWWCCRMMKISQIWLAVVVPSVKHVVSIVDQWIVVCWSADIVTWKRNAAGLTTRHVSYVRCPKQQPDNEEARRTGSSVTWCYEELLTTAIYRNC